MPLPITTEFNIASGGLPKQPSSIPAVAEDKKAFLVPAFLRKDTSNDTAPVATDVAAEGKKPKILVLPQIKPSTDGQSKALLEKPPATQGADSNKAPVDQLAASNNQTPIKNPALVPPGQPVPSHIVVRIDGNHFDLLKGSNYDSANHPASTAKLMALYLTFRAMAEGKLQDTPEIRRNMVLAYTLSDNVAAEALGEALSKAYGKPYGELATETARGLGMNNSVFTNASGLGADLPNGEKQIVTAKEEAILLRIIMNLPSQYVRFFEETKENGHSSLNDVPGAKLCKTGYIGIAGKNEACVFERSNGKNTVRLAVVILGQPSNEARNQLMDNIIDSSFAQLLGEPTSSAVASANNALPARNQQGETIPPLPPLVAQNAATNAKLPIINLRVGRVPEAVAADKPAVNTTNITQPATPAASNTIGLSEKFNNSEIGKVLNLLFDHGGESRKAIICAVVGAAEGTININGTETQYYSLHEDPGDHLFNGGCFSFNARRAGVDAKTADAMTPDERNRAYLVILRGHTNQFIEKAARLGLQLDLFELLAVIDGANQAPKAVIAPDSYVEKVLELRQMIAAGKIPKPILQHIAKRNTPSLDNPREVIKWARVYAFATNKDWDNPIWEAPGLIKSADLSDGVKITADTPPEEVKAIEIWRIYNDQSRRVNQVGRALAFQLKSNTQLAALDKSLGSSTIALASPVPQNANPESKSSAGVAFKPNLLSSLPPPSANGNDSTPKFNPPIIRFNPRT